MRGSAFAPRTTPPTIAATAAPPATTGLATFATVLVPASVFAARLAEAEREREPPPEPFEPPFARAVERERDDGALVGRED